MFLQIGEARNAILINLVGPLVRKVRVTLFRKPRLAHGRFLRTKTLKRPQLMLIRKQQDSLGHLMISYHFKSIHLNSKEVDKTPQLPRRLSNGLGRQHQEERVTTVAMIHFIFFIVNRVDNKQLVFCSKKLTASTD